MSLTEARWAWMNGKMVPWEKATVHVSVHALHYGSGVFEGIRCYRTEDGPALFRLDTHLERFTESARVYGMTVPYTVEELTEAITELVSRNGFESCYVRPLCYRGSHDLKVDPEDCPVELSILAWPWAPLHGSESSKAGLRACISERKKFHSDMMPTTAKACGQYVNSILAIREAKAQGYDEPLLLNTEGYLAEAASENIFVVRDGTLYTNDEKDSILLGITRLSVIQIARDLGYKVKITRLRVDDVLNSHETFVTGTAAEVIPICHVDGKMIADGKCGPITERIQKQYMRIVTGGDPGYEHWLRPVRKTAAAQI
jgi:branched-chain amino acid aminotransferase